MQILCKAVGSLYARVGNLNLLVEINLTAVCFIGNTNDIASVGQHLQILGELLNGGQIDAAAFSALKFLAEFFTRVNADYGIITDIFFRADKLL